MSLSACCYSEAASELDPLLAVSLAVSLETVEEPLVSDVSLVSEAVPDVSDVPLVLLASSDVVSELVTEDVVLDVSPAAAFLP